MNATTRRATLSWLGAIVLNLGFLGWMVAGEEFARANGELVVLAVDPVDPFDPLRGRYLAIRPAVARLDPAALEIVADEDVPEAAPDEPLARWSGRPAALELESEGSPRGARRLLVGAAAQRARAPFLQARVLWSHDGRLHLDLGLDRYYIPGDAHDPTTWWRDGATRPELVLLVRVTARGRGAIEELRVDGTPFPEWNAARHALSGR